MPNIVSLLNTLSSICMVAGGFIIVLSVFRGAQNTSATAKFLSVDSGLALTAAGFLCEVIISNDLSRRISSGILVFMMLFVLALPKRIQKQTPGLASKLPSNNASEA